ncbi:hypothetical protein [Gordonia polyisoprenivorans]|uniref:hypothetical protein n=1 Tax=Gordonia polyisoprenivorans TaxID=84595 RepID=UPI002300ECF2|nr:hypothetical protein [Gordonia polyisoprenivorans]WCB37917.1 hypothetical protein PHA63_01780 [Gordonia polyisoprenivorans]
MSTTAKKKSPEIPSTLKCSSCGAEAQILTPLDDPEHFAEQIDSWNDEHQRCGAPEVVRRISDLDERLRRPKYETAAEIEARHTHRRPSWADKFTHADGDGEPKETRRETGFWWITPRVSIAAPSLPGQLKKDGSYGSAERCLWLSKTVYGPTKIQTATYFYYDGKWTTRHGTGMFVSEAREFAEVLLELCDVAEAEQ